MKYKYKTKNICPREIVFELNGDVVTNVEFLGGGCPGNLQALPKLVNEMKVSEIEEKIGGIVCGRKGTSCADQLSKAVRQALEESKNLV